MATDPAQKYTVFDLGYDKHLTKVDNFYQASGVMTSKNEAPLAVGKITGGGITGNVIMQNGYMKSGNYLAGVRGWYIDATRAEFPEISVSTGVIKYGKTSWTDSANSGYYLGPEGVYVGSAGDATLLKFPIDTGVMQYKGDLGSTITTTGYVKGGQTAFKTGDGFFQGYDNNPELEMWCYPSGSMGDYDWADGSLNPIAIRFPTKTDMTHLGQVTIQLKVTSGTSATIYCDIYEADSNFKPTGASLGQASIAGISNTTYERKNFTFSTPVAISGGDDYCAVFSCASTTPTLWLYYCSFSGEEGFRIDYYYSGAWYVETYTTLPWCEIYSYTAGYKLSVGNADYSFVYNGANVQTSADMMVFDPDYADRFGSYQSWGMQLYRAGQNTLLFDDSANGLHWFEPKITTAGRYSLGGIKPYYTLTGSNLTNSGLQFYSSYSGGVYLYSSASDVYNIVGMSYTTLVIGSATNKAVVHCGGLSSCPLPTIDGAATKLRTVADPVEKAKLEDPKKAHFEFADTKKVRKYFETKQMPEECRFVDPDGVEDVEVIRTVGFLFQAVRELAAELDAVKKKIK